MKSWKRFLADDWARIPFSVLGVFLILGSSITTVYISQLELQKSSEIASTIDFNEVEHLIKYAEADMATALNIAGMKGLKAIGQKPAIVADQTAGYGTTAGEVNRNRVKEIIMDELNVYLASNYLYNAFNDGTYAINVVNESPITSWGSVGFSNVDMHLDRPFTLPLIGPEASIDPETYWVASVPITIEIEYLNRANGSKSIATRTVEISSIITARYPLLENLVCEYEDTINGIKPLWTFTTVLANIYSLARGYKHYNSGEPLNIVDNKHLAPMINGGLLFEEGLVFGSADPLSLVDFAIECGKALKGSSNIDATSQFNMMDGVEFVAETADFAQRSANIDAGDDENTTIDDNPHINISEIAEMVLYNCTSVVLNFKNAAGNPVSVSLSNPTEEDIRDTVETYINSSHTFVNIEKGTLIQNQTTLSQINNITSTVYTAEMETKVERDPNPTIVIGNHGGYPIDNGTGPWIFDHYVATGIVDKPPKGSITSGCTLYGEIYDVYWTRLHYWSKKTVETSGNQTWVNWSYFTATDTKAEQDVTINIILNYYADCRGTANDVDDVFYRNHILNDENLEDTIDTYKNTILAPSRNNLIETGSGNSLTEKIGGVFYAWVETETCQALNDILNLIKDIKQDPRINSTTYPNPIDLMNAAKIDLLLKYENNIAAYLNKSSYQNGLLFSSVGKKAVYCTRDWYVYKVKDDIERIFSNIESKINEHLNDAIPSNADFDADDVKDALSGSAMGALQNQFAIPFGLDINLVHNDDDSNPEWNETIRLAVDQYPNYLSPYEKTEFGNEEIWTLKIRNRCTLGPTGFPILPPSPVTPWIVTLNVWLIDVEGEYAQFKVIDSSDETLFNPIFGHDPQIYIRKKESVFTSTGTPLGSNDRLSFGFTTVAFGVVPSWGMMVGDKQANFWDEHTPGFD